jgi:hypothetical protein
MNANDGEKKNNEVLANKVINGILLMLERHVDHVRDLDTLEIAHLLNALKEVK